MTPRDRLAWGTVAVLAFLVLLLGVRLVASVVLGPGPAALGALAAGVATVALAPRVERRMVGNGRA